METNNTSQPGILVTVRYTGNGREAAVQVDRFPYLIGRDSSSVQLALPDATVSRTHAQLIYRDGAVLLENISQTNKTSVNGRTIEQPVQLSSGDQAVMGSFRLTFEIQDDCAGAGVPEADQGVEASENGPEQAVREQLVQQPEPGGSGQDEARYCWKCGKALQPNEAFCADCGAETGREISGQVMFCGACGAKVGQGFAFCRKCGKPTAPGKRRGGVSEPAAARSPATGKRRRGLVLALVLLAAAVGVASFLLLGGRSYETVVKRYVDASIDGDFEAVWDLLPNQVKKGSVAYVRQFYDVEDISDVIDLLEDSYHNPVEYIREQDGEDVTFSYEIADEQEYSTVELGDLEEELQEAAEDIEVSSARLILIDLIATEPSGKSHTYTTGIVVAKIGRSWYLAGPGY